MTKKQRQLHPHGPVAAPKDEQNADQIVDRNADDKSNRYGKQVVKAERFLEQQSVR